jgi:CTP:molybdopterin cytidylyltransferase MocA
MSTYQLVVVMAGSSSRFQDAGYERPKALLLADNRVILERIISKYPSAESILIIANESQQKEVLSELERIGGSAKTKLAIIPSHDQGPSFSVAKASQFIDEKSKVVVTYCDVGVEVDETEIVTALDLNDAVCLAFRGFHPHILRNPTFGYLKCDSRDQVLDIREKKAFTNAPREEFTSAGVYGFNTGESLLAAIAEQKAARLEVAGELYLSLAVLALIRSGKQVKILRIDKFASWGTPEDLEDFNYYCKVQREMAAKSKFSVTGSRRVLLAGGKSERIRGKVDQSKQLLPISSDDDLLWSRGSGAIGQDDDFVMFTSPALYREMSEAGLLNERMTEVGQQTKSSLETALLGLEKVGSWQNQAVTFCATDNIVGFTENFELDPETYDLKIWVAHVYPIADIDPTQFSWASVSDSGRIEDIFIKHRPIGAELTHPLVGNFSFKSLDLAESLIRETLERGQSLGRELHMEDVALLAIEKGMRVKVLKCPVFLGVGTPEEFDLYGYLLGPEYQDL